MTKEKSLKGQSDRLHVYVSDDESVRSKVPVSEVNTDQLTSGLLRQLLRPELVRFFPNDKPNPTVDPKRRRPEQHAYEAEAVTSGRIRLKAVNTGLCVMKGTLCPFC